MLLKLFKISSNFNIYDRRKLISQTFIVDKKVWPLFIKE